MERRKLRFGVFELDLSAGELRKSGIRIKLQEQPLRILEVLLNHPGQIVSRDELRNLLWPSDISVDFDRGLNTAVNKLREALGDSAQAPRFIETIPRRGYRFVAPVEELESAQARPAGGGTLHQRFAFLLTAGVLASALAAGWLWDQRRTDPLTVEPRPLTSYAGIEVHASFSPDGSRLAFSWNGEGQNNFDIYVVIPGAEPPVRLTTAPEPDFSPAWSPHGDLIAFMRNRSDTSSVYVVPATGGPERHVMDLHVPISHFVPIQLAWLADGETLIAPDQEGTGRPMALFAWSIATGEKRRLTVPPAQSSGDHSPSVSPDGRLLLFSRGSFGNGRLYRASLSAPDKAIEVKAANVNPRSGTWSDSGRAIVAVGGTQHWSGLWLLSAADQHPPVPLVRSPTGQPAAPWFGLRVAYTRADWDANIWRLSLENGQRLARPLITSTYVDHLPDLSPDGSRVAFVSTRSGVQGLYVCDREGRSIVKLTSAGMISAVRWSPAGDRLAFAATTSDRNQDIYLVRSDGSGLHRLTTDVADDLAPSWSGNGEWIYFGSNRTGSFEIWKMRLDGRPPTRVTFNGGFQARESADGHFLYYAKRDSETSLWRRASAGGSEDLILPSLSTSANFAVLPHGIVYIPGMDAAQHSAIELFEFSSGSSKVLMKLDKRPVWGLAARGDEVLFTQVDRESTDLMIIDPVPQPGRSGP